MNQTTTRLLIVLVLIASIFSSYSVMASEDDHRHDHKEHHSNTEKKLGSKSHHEHNHDEDNHQDHEKHDHHDDQGEEETKVDLDQNTIEEFGIKIDKAKSGWIKKTKLFPGEITIHLDYLAHVTPRFPGLVKKIYKHIGEDVKKGDVLAIIESNDSLTPYKVVSPISGTIIEKHLTLGESVEANSHAFEIANINTVWATFSIFQDMFDEIKKGQKAVVLSSNGKHKINGTISYISPTVDQHTRTQAGRIVLPNRDHHWKPGMFVDVNVVFSKIKSDIVVPKTAIQYIDNKPVVFVKDDGEFEPHSVVLGESDVDSVVILSGLNKGLDYVSDGGFILKAELEKDSMGHGHVH